MHILHTARYTFPMVLTRRIYLKNRQIIKVVIISIILITYVFGEAISDTLRSN